MKGTALNRVVEQLFSIQARIDEESRDLSAYALAVKRAEHRLWLLNKKLVKRRKELEAKFLQQNSLSISLRTAKRTVLVEFKLPTGELIRKRLVLLPEDQFVFVWMQPYVDEISSLFWTDFLSNLKLPEKQKIVLEDISRIKISVKTRRSAEIYFWEKKAQRFFQIYNFSC